MSEAIKNVIPVECPYCGQSKMVEDTGDPDQNRQQAVDSCYCEGAKSERRKKQREDKKRRYLEQRFTNEADRDFIKACINVVDTWDTGVESVQVKMSDGYTHKIYLNKDNDLKIKATKKNEEEVTI